MKDHGDDVEKQKSWVWVTKADLKATTEALIFVAQEQAIRTNYVRFLTDKTISSPLCRMSGHELVNATSWRKASIRVDMTT